MPRYEFTGEQPETFPSIVLVYGDGYQTLTAEPGGVYELPDEIDHPRLLRIDQPAPEA